VKRELSAGGVVVRSMHGRDWVAAVRPRRDGRKPAVWALPKGLIDQGETPAETAVREVYEETGLTTRVERKLGDVRYVYTASWEGGSGERIFKVVSFFLLRPLRGRLGDLPPGMEIEVEDTRWLPLEDATRLLSYGGEREMAGRALEALAGMRL
jgi:8-oxo-dGTP pyrophosphatase MutT (NUDIX family)